MNLFRRTLSTPSEPQLKSVRTRAIMVNGQYRTVAELRSTYGTGVRLVSNAQGIISGDYSPEELANAYKTGLTTFIGINTRCGISAEIPVHCVDRTGTVIEDGPAQAFIKNSPKYIWRLLAHSVIWGANYIHKVPNRHGYTSGLEILSPLDVEPEMDYSRGVVRRYRVVRAGGTIAYYTPDEMIVNLTFNPFSDIDGTGALEPAKVRNDIETNIGRYGAMFFANSARPDLIINTEEDLDAKELIAAKKSYTDSFKGVLNSFRAWFAAGRKYTITPISTNPVDLAMVELTNQADMKILAAIKCNPILAGIGTASDPLSAQGTYEQVRRQQVDFVAIPDVRDICNMLNEQWLHCDFPNGADRYRLEPDISAIQSDSLGTGERVTTATNAVTNRVWTVNEAREYTGKQPLQYAIGINPEWSWGNWDRGLMKRSQVLKAQGYDPDTIGGPDGFIYELDPRFKVAASNMQPPPAAYFPNPGIQRSIQAPKPPAPPPEDVLTVETIPLKRNAETMAQVEELRMWARKVQKRGARTHFAAEIIPSKIVAFVRTNLDAGWSSVSVFDAAKTWIRSGQPQDVSATEQQALEFWRHFDELSNDVREGWLGVDYMSAVWEAVRPHLDNLSDVQVQAALSAQHNKLVDAWVGTKDAPGALTALFLAGAVAGDKSLQRGGPAKPHRAIIATPAISFDLVSQEALDYVRQYAFGLIKGIDSTTVEMVRKAVSDGVEQGQSRDEIARSLFDVFHDENRSRLIAQSEGMNTYNEGATTRWQQVGVTQARWRTVGMSACPLCKRLNGQVADLRTGWTDPDTGIVYKHSAHPGDRCFREPIL